MFDLRLRGMHLYDQFRHVTLISTRFSSLSSPTPAILVPHDTCGGDYFPLTLPCLTLAPFVPQVRVSSLPAPPLSFPPLLLHLHMQRENEVTCRGELYCCYMPAVSLFPRAPFPSSHPTAPEPHRTKRCLPQFFPLTSCVIKNP